MPSRVYNIFLMTVHHVVIRPDSDDNDLVEYTNTALPRSGWRLLIG
jgi:hypothetical protein